MRDEPESMLISMRVADGPPRTRVRKRTGRCDICGFAVWIARTSPLVDRYRCLRCAIETVPHNAKFEPLTAAQMADVKTKMQ